MKVELNQNILHGADTDKISYGNSHFVKDQARIAGEMGGYLLDISSKVTDNTAFGMGELKAPEDYMQEAGQVNVALQSKYMAVMSNSMSAEDFAELEKDGFSVKNTVIEDQVTSLDKIKAKLAENGTIISGFNDKLSDAELENITGSISESAIIKDALKNNDLPVNADNVSDMAKAMSKASALEGVTDEMKKYMLINNLEPSIENLYRAQYSSATDNGRVARGYYQETSGYYSIKAETLDYESIRGQARSVIERAGLEVNEETENEAKWIIEKGIYFTEKSISLLNKLDNLTLPMSDALLADKIAIAYADGKSAEQAVLTQKSTIAKQASEVYEALHSVTEEKLAAVALSGKVLNIKNLANAHPATISDRDSGAFVSAMRFLEETRLQMTLEANRTLIKNGIDVDIVPLTELVDKLKEAELQYYGKLFSDNNSDGEHDISISRKVDMFKQVNEIFDSLKSIPAEVLGRINKKSDEAFTPNGLYNEGLSLKKSYEEAGKSYETLMTAPRKDLGDSITKAFRNVDAILEDNDFALTDDNRKAVRILGYAGMDINEEAIKTVREAEKAVRRVIEAMTPARTIEMIKRGENPLDENIYDLNEKLSEHDRKDDTDRYAKFLLRLEKNGQINDSEKEAYIGIYRLFHQIEKSDGKLIGNVLDEGKELTLRNLLSASRSNRSRGMDYKVDDNFGGIEGIRNNASISDQIDGYYQSLVRDVLDNISPQTLMGADYSEDTGLEEFADKLTNQQDDNQIDYASYEEDMSSLSEALESDSSVINDLMSNSQAVTVDNILAADRLINNRGSMASDLMGLFKGKSAEDRIKKAIDKIADDFTDEASAKKAYDDFADISNRELGEIADESDNYIDVREMSMLHKQLSVAAGNSLNENYEVPVEIDGKWTSINLKLVRDEENGGKVTATMETAEYGKIAAEFRIDDKAVSGYINGDKKEGIDALIKLDTELRKGIESNGRTIKSISYLDSDKVNINSFAKNADVDNSNNKADTSDLYEVGKAVIQVVRKMAG